MPLLPVLRVPPAAFVRGDELQSAVAERASFWHSLALLVFLGQRVRAGAHLRLDLVAGSTGIGQANFGIGPGAGNAPLAARPVMNDP